MSTERQQIEAAIAAFESQRNLLGDVVVDASVAAMRARLAALEPSVPIDASQTLKQVSILFLDVVGSTTLSQKLDPEETAVVMDGALSRGTSIVAAHRGRVFQYAGDSLLAVFGADESREDDAERAVRCGLALLALGRTVGAEVAAAHGHAGFDVRIGIHTGDAVLGGGVMEDGSIRGLAVNVAARMEQTAPPGALRISKDTYTPVRGVFDVIPQEPLTVKGVDAPVTSYLVERVKPRAFRVASRGIEGVATRMVGRDEELEVLQDAFRRLVKPAAGFERITVVAEAGVGKSRLLHEFRDWAEARTETFFVFQARATPQTQGQSYGLLRDALAWRFEIGDGDAMDVAMAKLEAGIAPLFAADEGTEEAQAHAHLLGQLIGLDYADSIHIRGILDDGRQIRNRGFHAAAQALRRIAAQGGSPLVVYLDDLHWADDESLDFIDYLAQVNRDVPMLLVALARPTLFERRPDAEAPNAQRIALHALDRTGSRLLADELLRPLPEVPAALRALVTGGADGNPFYMEELVRMLIDQKAIDASGARWSVDADKLLSLKVPPTLTGVLQARLDGLPPSERHALQLASVIGLNFWDAALAHVAPSAAPALKPLVRRELVSARVASDEGSTDEIREYAFQHQILHQVVYDTVLKRAKRDAHGKAAEWLAEHSGARAKAMLGTAAAHYEQAGEPARAAEFYARAAEQAASTFANAAVLDYVARALPLAGAEDHALRWRLHVTRERALDLLARRPAQREDVEALLALAEQLDDDRRRAEAAIRNGMIAGRVGDYGTSEAEGRRSMQLATHAGDDELTLMAINVVANAMAFRGEASAGRTMVEAALERARQLGLMMLQFSLAISAGICAEAQGDLAGGMLYMELQLSLGRSVGDRRAECLALSNVGLSYLRLGDFARAAQYLEDALRLHRSVGDRRTEGATVEALSELALRQGEDALALTRAEAAIAICLESGGGVHLGDALRALGNAELSLGRYDASASAWARSEEAARDMGDTVGIFNALEGQARLALVRGDVERATRVVARLLVEAGVEPSAVLGPPAAGRNDPLEGAFKPMIHTTMYRVWSQAGDPRADTALAEAYRCVSTTADAIGDAGLRQGFLSNLAENREIVALWEARQAVRPH